MSFDMVRPFNNCRHPELVSGSISPSCSGMPHKILRYRRAVSKPSNETARWTLKQVQGDGVFGAVS
jgi:hypothetical protein